ncbi:MAG TPA: TonB-dependent receptor [Gemmatimonadaceae bacterium]|nr:TonB-dependent receptor [Gemmatimonadaceae bacterium]
MNVLHSSCRLLPTLRRAALAVVALGLAAPLVAAQGPATPPSAAQQPAAGTGRIVGRVVDATTGAGLTDVGVQVVGTTIGTMSGLDGRFTILKVPAGTVTLQARRIGYQAKTITGLMLAPNGALEQNIALSSAAVSLASVVVTAESERGTVSEALDQQRNAAGIITSITSEQIAKSPDSDAAQAVQRVSGVTVQDGKYVFVRGLGERYTTTSLNGARLPSPEPERKVVPLDLFPSGMLQSITTSKTFTPDQPGDFSGAQVNIRTKEFPATRQIAFSTTLGMNTAAVGHDLPSAPNAGMEWLGLASGDRGIPGRVAAFGNFDSAVPTSGDFASMVSGFRNAWTPSLQGGTPNGSMSVTVGGSDPLFGRPVGYAGSFTYSYGQEVRANEVRAYAEPTGGTREIDRFEGTTGRSTVLWGGMLNLSTMLGNNSRLSLNNTYSRSADNEARRERGMSENLGQELQVDRMRYVERSIFSSQLAGEHQLDDRHKLDWAVTGSGVTRLEPDRSEFVRVLPADGGASYWLDGPEAAVRTFGDLSEQSINGSADYSWSFGSPERSHTAKFGALMRYTSRDAVNNVYSIRANNLSVADRQLGAEQIFDGRFTAGGSNPNSFLVTPLNQGGSYDASDLLGAGYAMLEYSLTDRLQLVGGARLEVSDVKVNAQPTVGAVQSSTPQFTDVLPSLALNYKLTGDQNLRVSASQTLARPEYRELAPVQFRDVIGAENVIGNASLNRTLIQNADVRWEWYPEAGELLSVALFAKRFQDPIERVFLSTSGTRLVTFLNAEEGRNVGIELEARKNLGFLGAPLAPLTVFANGTLMHSEITIGDDARLAKEERAMVGQAPYVVNAGVTYASESGRASATLLFNQVGRRIVTASEAPLPVTYEEPRGVLDLSLRFPIWQQLSGKFDARNLLDSEYLQTQGTVTRESYHAGRVFQFGLSWQP